MEQPWYFVLNQEAQGPVTGANLVQLALQGTVEVNTPVWTNGLTDWSPFGSHEALMQALRQAAVAEPAPKRPRIAAGSARPPSPRLAAGAASWVEQLDEASTVDLFEKALFEIIGDVIRERPDLRDALLTAYIKRHPASDDRNPASYEFSDDFLLEAVDDFESREEMWRVLGADNEAAVKDVITGAAHLDRLYCAQLRALALLSRARRLLRGGGGNGASKGAQPPHQAEQLVQLMQQEEDLALSRDMDGRSLWHDLVALERLDLLQVLLPVAAAAGFAGVPSAGQSGLQINNEQQPNGAGSQVRNGAAAQQQQQRRQQSSSAPMRAHCLNLPDAQGNTPLHLAVESAQLDVARLLIGHGASLDMQNRDPSRYAAGNWSVRSRGKQTAVPVPSLHQTPLHIAAEAGDLDMVQLLVEQGAMLDLQDTAGSTPLHLALEAQDERTVELLLAGGANPVLCNNDMGSDSTPLHAAAAAGRPPILGLLLGTGKLGDSINKPGEQGFTPLHLAARRGSRECVLLLLEHGADRAARNEAGKTPLDIARVNKREAVVQLLEQPSAA